MSHIKRTRCVAHQVELGTGCPKVGTKGQAGAATVLRRVMRDTGPPADLRTVQSADLG